MHRTGKVYCPRNSFPANKPWLSTTKRIRASSGTAIINVNVSFHFGLKAEIQRNRYDQRVTSTTARKECICVIKYFLNNNNSMSFRKIKFSMHSMR